MEKGNREELLRQIATRYAQADGERLLAELAGLDRQEGSRITPRLDRRVRAISLQAKRRRYARVAGLLAACLILALAAPPLLRYGWRQDLSSAQSSPAGYGESAARDEVAEDEAVVVEEAPAAGVGDYAVIPLTFTLPENFAVAGVEQDNARSVYFLSDQRFDDVVLTLERTTRPPETGGLVEIEIDGVLTYGISTGDYSLLTFNSGDILYTLTCRYDINTLLPLGRSIL